MTKWAVISKSDKDAEGLETKSLSNEIGKLVEDGYSIVNLMGKHESNTDGESDELFVD